MFLSIPNFTSALLLILSRARIFKLFRSLGIDSYESISTAYVAWRVGIYDNTIPARFLASIDCSKILAQEFYVVLYPVQQRQTAAQQRHCALF
jgi:hypothetical protein